MKWRLKFIALCFIIWIAVILLSLASSYFNALLLDTPFHINQEIPFLGRWVIWFPLTPFALNMATRVKYTETKPIHFFLYHAGIYILLCTIHILLASALASYTNLLLNGRSQYQVILIKCALTGVFYNFIIYSILILLVNGIAYYQALQTEKMKNLSLEKSVVDTRLQFLKQQLQPHFLFNAHHSVITLMKLDKKDKAIEMMEKLSELMRTALRESNEQKVQLQKEIAILRLYLDIQKIRFEDRLNVDYTIATGMHEALVPSMILQPLVENSIKYVVESSPNMSKITVGAYNINGSLILTVKDQSENWRMNHFFKKGIGLTNSEERLVKLYGANYKFELIPYEAGVYSGLEVKITIPLQHEV